MVKPQTNAGKDWLMKAMIAKVLAEFRIDTGSQMNLLPVSLFWSVHIGQ